jgi:hypothetical protein
MRISKLILLASLLVATEVARAGKAVLGTEVYSPVFCFASGQCYSLGCPFMDRCKLSLNRANKGENHETSSHEQQSR